MVSYEMTKYPIKKKSKDKVVVASTTSSQLPVLKGGLKENQILRMGIYELADKILEVLRERAGDRAFLLQDLMMWFGVDPKAKTKTYYKLYNSLRELIKRGDVIVLSKGRYKLSEGVPKKPSAEAELLERTLDLLSAIKKGDLAGIKKISPELEILIRKGLVRIEM